MQSKLPESDKSTSRLKDEALIIVGAGTLTTSWALSIAVFYILSAPDIFSKLKPEPVFAIPNADTQTALHKLEQLQYLTAVIQEALRLSYGVCSRLQRISPDRHLIFSDSYTFRPERWIDNPRPEKYLAAFSKCSRQCLGINLAYVEMYPCLSAVFKMFGSSNAETSANNGTHADGILQLYAHDFDIQAD